jgi:hypothetical protein
LFSPANKEELFNLRHAQARNIIERIFGVLKNRFKILLHCPSYSVEVQAQIPAALCTIHNFIHLHHSQEREEAEEESTHGRAEAGDDIVRQVGFIEVDDNNDAVVQRRDSIAQAMWIDYQRLLQEQNQMLQ